MTEVRGVELTPTKAYTDEHSRSGLEVSLPEIATWPNQFKNYEITITVPEYTSVCPKTNLPDFGTLTIKYTPDRVCLELKSLKYYLLAYRNLGIFYENAINRILDDIVKSCQPVSCVVQGEFNTRGGMRSMIEARHPRETARKEMGTHPVPAKPGMKEMGDTSRPSKTRDVSP